MKLSGLQIVSREVEGGIVLGKATQIGLSCIVYKDVFDGFLWFLYLSLSNKDVKIMLSDS